MTGMTVRLRSVRSGIALVIVLVSLLVLGTVAAAVVTVGSAHLSHAYSGSQSQEAIYAARAGAYIKMGQVRSGDLNAISTTEMKGSKATYSATVTAPGSSSKSFPPPDTYYIESVGTSAGGTQRRMGILVSLSQSRWNHAIFGNSKVYMKDGSYTNSFNSDNGEVDHSKASVATNSPDKGVEIGKSDSVVIGWANAIDPTTGKVKEKKKEDDIELDPKANVQGPPGSIEKLTVKSKSGVKNKAYRNFEVADQLADMAPVVLPKSLPPGTVGTIDTSLNPVPLLPSVDTNIPTAVTVLPPGAYYDLKVGAAQVATLDVSAMPEGSTAEYIFHAIDLKGGTLTVKQPAVGKPVTVKVYIDTGSGPALDKTAGLRMEGSSLVNPIAKPINLQFLIAGEGTVTLEGHTDLKDGPSPTAYYVAYAPEAHIEVLKGQIYGALVADTVTLDGASILDPSKAPAVVHYDVTLLKDEENPPIFHVLSVRYF